MDVTTAADEPRRLSGDFNALSAIVDDSAGEALMPAVAPAAAGVTNQTVSALVDDSAGDASTPGSAAARKPRKPSLDADAQARLDAAIARAEAAAQASEQAAKGSLAGHEQAELAAEWIKAELAVVEAMPKRSFEV